MSGNKRIAMLTTAILTVTAVVSSSCAKKVCQVHKTELKRVTGYAVRKGVIEDPTPDVIEFDAQFPNRRPWYLSDVPTADNPEARTYWLCNTCQRLYEVEFKKREAARERVFVSATDCAHRAGINLETYALTDDFIDKEGRWWLTFANRQGERLTICVDGAGKARLVPSE